MFLERQTECSKKRVSFLVGFGRSYECHLKSVDTGVLVDVNLREDDLLLETKGVVALSVHLLGYTVEVTDTWKGDPDEPLEELVHPDVTKGDLSRTAFWPAMRESSAAASSAIFLSWVPAPTPSLMEILTSLGTSITEE